MKNLLPQNKDRLWQMVQTYLLPSAFYLLIVLAISYGLLPFTGGLNYTDSTFYFNSGAHFSELVSAWHPMFGGHDFSFNLFSQIPETIYDSTLSFLSPNEYIASYLAFFFPFFVTLLVANFVFRKIFKDQLLALLLPLFIIFNNFTLQSIYSGSNSFILRGYVSSLLVLYICFLIYKNGIDFKKTVALALASFITFHPFVFIAENILILIFFIFYLLTTPASNRLRTLKFYASYLGVSFALGAFWILPFVYESLHVSNDSIHGSSNNLSVFSAYEKISTLVNSFSFVAFFNNVSKVLYFSTIQYVFYFCIAAICSIPFLLRVKIKLLSKELWFLLLFIGLSFLIFIDLSLGPSGPIFGGIFSYLWTHFSFFSFFRSFKRFYILIPVLVAFLLGISLIIINMQPRIKNIVLVLFTCILIGVHWPLLTGNLSNSITNFTIPVEYKELNHFLSQDSSRVSVIAFPYNSYEWYSWTTTENKKLNAPDLNWIQYYLQKPYFTLRTATYLITSTDLLQTVNTDIKSNRDVQETLSLLNVKYILVNKDLVTGKGTPINYSYYVSYFSTHGYPAVMETDLFTVYLNSDFKPVLSLSDNTPLNFNEILPTMYRVSIQDRNIGSKQSLKFLQNYSQSWGVYDYYNFVSNEDVNFALNLMVAPFQASKAKNTHQSIVNGYGNTWDIPVDSETKTLDLLIIFKTESIFLIGLFVTLLTLLASLLFVIKQKLRF
ncbi:MAG: hypothetical protein WCI89_03500 [bacterium]